MPNLLTDPANRIVPSEEAWRWNHCGAAKFPESRSGTTRGCWGPSRRPVRGARSWVKPTRELSAGRGELWRHLLCCSVGVLNKQWLMCVKSAKLRLPGGMTPQASPYLVSFESLRAFLLFLLLLLSTCLPMVGASSAINRWCSQFECPATSVFLLYR